MDAHLTFWTGALIVLGFASACVSAGFVQIRLKNYIWHRRLMQAATVLIVIFLVGYALKLFFLGRENFQYWTSSDLRVLHIHESFMLLLILCIAGNIYLKQRFVVAIEPAEPGEPGSSPGGQVEFRRGEDRARRWHRRLGRVAVIATLFGLLTAAIVLQGMYRRASTAAQSSIILRSDQQIGQLTPVEPQN